MGARLAIQLEGAAAQLRDIGRGWRAGGRRRAVNVPATDCKNELMQIALTKCSLQLLAAL